MGLSWASKGSCTKQLNIPSHQISWHQTWFKRKWLLQKQTIYKVHAPSSLARLLRYRHSSEQASVEANHFVPSPVLYLSRPDCMCFTSIWFEADFSLIFSQVMVLLQSEIGWTDLANGPNGVPLAMWFARRSNSKLYRSRGTATTCYFPGSWRQSSLVTS